MKSKRAATAMFYMAVFSVLSGKVAADGCDFGGEEIQVGETVSLADPFWIRETSERYRKKGYSEQEIAEVLKASDWTHLVLECVNTFVPATVQDDSTPFGMVDFSEPAMVPLRHQVEWVNSEKGRVERH